jgi:hypothetical protein
MSCSEIEEQVINGKLNWPTYISSTGYKELLPAYGSKGEGTPRKLTTAT